MTYTAEHVANGAVPSHHWVQVPDENEMTGHRTIVQTETIHEARTVARRHSSEFSYIRSVPMMQDALGDFFWCESTWDGRVIRWGYGTDSKVATVEDANELADWLADPGQVGVSRDIAREEAEVAREEAEQAELDERRLSR